MFGAFVAGVLVGAPGAGKPARLASLRISVMWVLAPILLATAALRMDPTALATPSVTAQSEWTVPVKATSDE